MNANKHDPIFDSLDRLAGMADDDVVGDRMPEIQRRVRMARRRRVAGAGVAAVTLVAVGFGIWKGLPAERSTPDPAPDRPEIHQTVTIVADAVYSDLIHIRFTVEGASSAYADATTGDPVPAGPRLTEVLVDGKPVTSTDGGNVVCEAGADVTSYSQHFPKPNKEKFIPAEVSGPGEHVVEIRAPYCVDGKLVDEPTQVTVTTETAPPVVMNEKQGDVDGDGQQDTVQLFKPGPGELGNQELRVTWGGGDGVSSASVDNDMDRRLTLQDIDGDGRLELILDGGGGESVTWRVFRITADRTLEEVTTVNQAGDPEPLSYGFSDTGPQNTFWQLELLPDGIYSWRYQDASPTRPAPVDVRKWVLSTDTLTLQDVTAPGCVDTDFKLSLGSC